MLLRFRLFLSVSASFQIKGQKEDKKRTKNFGTQKRMTIFVTSKNNEIV